MKIPIVNEQDEVIGEEERSVIHKTGLKHREIHVWLVTSEKEFIFSIRGPHQDTWPSFLDATCGGHVDTALETYQECAERELYEETGVKTPLKLVAKLYSESYDPNTNSYNNAFRATFAGIYDKDIGMLIPEKDHGKGFKKFSIDQIINMPDDEKSKVIPFYFEESYFEMYRKILDALFKD